MTHNLEEKEIIEIYPEIAELLLLRAGLLSRYYKYVHSFKLNGVITSEYLGTLSKYLKL